MEQDYQERKKKTTACISWLSQRRFCCIPHAWRWLPPSVIPCALPVLWRLLVCIILAPAETLCPLTEVRAAYHCCISSHIFLPVHKHPCSSPNPIQAVPPARRASFLTQARLFTPTLSVRHTGSITASPFHSCFSRHSGLYFASSWVLNNFRLLFFPLQHSLCGLYQKHKSFFSGTLGYFFEERLPWCPDTHLLLGPVDKEEKKNLQIKPKALFYNRGGNTFNKEKKHKWWGKIQRDGQSSGLINHWCKQMSRQSSQKTSATH